MYMYKDSFRNDSKAKTQLTKLIEILKQTKNELDA